MNLSFAEHVIELRSWPSKRELIDFLAHCDAGSIMLGEDAGQESEFYSAVLHLNYSAISLRRLNESGGRLLGIGICSENPSVKPNLLLLPERQMLIFGFNSEVVGVSVEDKEVYFRTVFDHLPFRSFIYLEQTRSILVFHEIGVAAITEEGQELWRFDKDVIVGCSMGNEMLHLDFMDSPSITLNTLTGAKI
jgi:hypothetical protein